MMTGLEWINYETEHIQGGPLVLKSNISLKSFLFRGEKYERIGNLYKHLLQSSLADPRNMSYN